MEKREGEMNEDLRTHITELETQLAEMQRKIAELTKPVSIGRKPVSIGRPKHSTPRRLLLEEDCTHDLACVRSTEDSSLSRDHLFGRGDIGRLRTCGKEVGRCRTTKATNTP